MSDQPENASICPLCGADNACTLPDAQSTKALTKQQRYENSNAACSKNSLDCWCTTVNLDPQQKTLLKNSTDGTRCLCQSCLMRLAQNGLKEQLKKDS